MVCLCLSGDTLASWSTQLERNSAWSSMVELRVDLLKPSERSPEAMRRWRRTHCPDVPVILTIRRSRDLGRWEGDEAQRAYLMEELLEALRPEYVDVELDRQGVVTWERIAQKARALGATVVRSHHEPRETPRELSHLLARLAAEAREIPKLAVQMHSLADLSALVQAADEFRLRMPGRRAVWIGMGEEGLLTRVFPARLGSTWTYGTDVGTAGAPGAAVAPGQVDTRTLRELYRVGEAKREWRLFAVLGNPVAHSRSPEYHNGRFAAEGVPAIYVPLRVSDFSIFPALADQLAIQGVSVTVPHKEAALRLALAAPEGVAPEGNALEGNALEHSLLRRVGAANTLVRTADGEWYGENTDVRGFLDPLQEVFPRLAGLRVAVIGAGGAARGVVAGLVAESAEVYVFNRTFSRAEALLRDMELPRERAYPLAELESWQDAPFDLIVQTTTAGMNGEDPIPRYSFRGTETVFDIIYTPPVTPLLERARAAGCRTMGGRAMFERQAELQYRLFTALIAAGGASR